MMELQNKTYQKSEGPPDEWPFRYLTSFNYTGMQSCEPEESMLAAQAVNSSFSNHYYNEFDSQHVHSLPENPYNPSGFGCYGNVTPAASRNHLVRPMTEHTYASSETSQESSTHSSDYLGKPHNLVLSRRSQHSEQPPHQVDQTAAYGPYHHQPNFWVKIERPPESFHPPDVANSVAMRSQLNYQQPIAAWVPRHEVYMPNRDTESLFKASSAGCYLETALAARQYRKHQCTVSQPHEHSRAVLQDKYHIQSGQVGEDVEGGTCIARLPQYDNRVACGFQDFTCALTESLHRSDDDMLKAIKQDAQIDTNLPKQQISRWPNHVTFRDESSEDKTALSSIPRCTSHSPLAEHEDDPKLAGGLAASEKRRREDAYLKRGRAEGKSYATIKLEGNFRECVSTLRGRYRNMTTPKHQRVRKPVWAEKDLALLEKAVMGATPLAPQRTRSGLKHRQPVDKHRSLKTWKSVSEFIAKNGGYRFGYTACRKKWDDICRAKGYRFNEAVLTKLS